MPKKKKKSPKMNWACEDIMLYTVVFIGFCIIVSIYDSKTLRIPDVLLFICFLALSVLGFQNDLFSVLNKTLALLLGYVIFFIIYHFSGGLGYGDVKYAALLGFALGLENVCIAFLFTSAGALLVYAIGLFFFRWDKSAKLPFAPFLSLGAAITELVRIAA
jgi:prepilin signal peptidase PulO-like enzyme (type II secretory pathway)